MISTVDAYLIHGCMRCKYGNTPQCKVYSWQNELNELRRIVLSCHLTEEIKWSVPCYTHNKKNILIISAFKDYACISFFYGSLINDTKNILLKQGENSQQARIIKFSSVKEILSLEKIIKNYITQSIEIESSGIKPLLQPKEIVFIEELLNILNNDNEYKVAFYKLSPSKQRGYNIYFSQPKQTETKISRILKSRDNILKGLGWNDTHKA